MLECIKNMAKLQNDARWIPVTERLPEDAFGCLVTVMDYEPYTQTEFENILPYFVGYDGESWNDSDGEKIPFEVIAWMPLPEPYRESEMAQMAIKPILFNTEMVRAILDGRKSCTRRICKDGNEYTVPDMDFYDSDKRTYAVHNYSDKENTDKLGTVERSCPICPGDILYVQETFIQASTHTFWYKADDKSWMSKDLLWKPSIHMPKEAARIWLKVTDVRVERLQEITETQAQAEGCNSGLLTGACSARGQFEDLCNSTIKKSDLDRYGWNANPYVFVIEFVKIDKPEEIQNA